MAAHMDMNGYHYPYHTPDQELMHQNGTLHPIPMTDDALVEHYRNQDATIPSWLDQEEALLENALNCQLLDQGYANIPRQEQLDPYAPNQYGGHRDFSAGGGIRIRSTAELGTPYKDIFGFEMFNPMQSACLDDAFYRDCNLLISAPTGSGKTAVMEIAIIRAFSVFGGDAKIIYMAPIKSLCSERAADWQRKFQNFGVTCQEFTGDSDFITIDAIKNTNIIVTTPEKWDSMTRRWKDNRSMMQLIKLFVIDEVHILNDTRGAVLEACVSRMKTIGQHMRYVAVSATVPNVQDVADWLHANVLAFSHEFRPVRLEKHIYGIPFSGDNMFAFEKKLDYKLPEMIAKHGKNKPVLIFCSTRKSAQSSCEAIIKAMERNGQPTLGDRPAQQMAIKDKKLKEYIPKGLAFHHAGLDPEDRKAVEQLFLNRSIRVVATTSTLALGVNLPAYLVIIKSTKVYQGGAMVDYSDIDILQMIGRAGRPGLEDSACAVILTTQSMEFKYNNLLQGSREIESSLHLRLVEHLMTEICLGTITDMDSSIKWLRSTFLYVRIKKNPFFYQAARISSSTSSPDVIMEEICKSSIELLVKEGFVQVSNSPSLGAAYSTYKATDFGAAMDRYCIKVGTMTKIMKMEHCSSARDMLDLVSHAEEFATIRFAAGEKPFLNSLQKNPNIRFPLTERVTCIADKVFLVLQCILGDVSLHSGPLGSSLALESFQILQHATRIAKCIIDCAVCEHNATKVKHALDLHRSLKAKMWSTSSNVLRQLERLGPQMTQKLAQAGISTFEQLRATDARRIEVILRRNPPFGNQILEAVDNIPQFHLQVQQSRSISSGAEVILSITASVLNTKKFRRQRFGKGHFAQLWTETSDHVLLDFRRTTLKRLQEQPQSFTLRVTVTSPSIKILCHLQSEDYIGINVMQQIVPDVDPACVTPSLDSPETAIHQNPNEVEKLNTSEELGVIDVDDIWPIEDDLDEEMLLNLPDARDFDLVPSPRTVPKAKPAKACKHTCKDKDRCKHACCKVRPTDQNQNPRKRQASFSQAKLQLGNISKRVKSLPPTSVGDSTTAMEEQAPRRRSKAEILHQQLEDDNNSKFLPPSGSMYQELVDLTGQDELFEDIACFLDDDILALDGNGDLQDLSQNEEYQRNTSTNTKGSDGNSYGGTSEGFDSSDSYHVKCLQTETSKASNDDRHDPFDDIWNAVGDYAYQTFNDTSNYVLQQIHKGSKGKSKQPCNVDKSNAENHVVEEHGDNSIARWLELNTEIITD